MKYIKRNLQIVEPEINEEGYYVVGNVAIHPDIFHRDYQPLGFTLTSEEVEIVKKTFEGLKTLALVIDPNLDLSNDKDAEDLLTRLKQWQ